MGWFLSMSGIIGKTTEDVASCLQKFAIAYGGGLLRDNVKWSYENVCVIGQEHGNTTILYPGNFLQWDDASMFLSKELKTSVFSFHIHDGDLWMYVLYNNGTIVDQFNPIPDYWVEDISKEEFERWQGSAESIVRYVPEVDRNSICKYLTRWDLDLEQQKAYEEDEFEGEEQIFDFMKKLKLQYPLDANDEPTGQVFKFWIQELKLKEKSKHSNSEIASIERKWWKFW